MIEKVIAKMDMETFRQMKDLEYKVEKLEKELAEYRWSVGQVSRAVTATNGLVGLSDRDGWANFMRCLENLMSMYEKYQYDSKTITDVEVGDLNG
jgi:hypothetical protein